MSGQSPYCIHDIDLRYSRCGTCERIASGQVTAGDVAREVIWDASSFVNRYLSQQFGPPPLPKRTPAREPYRPMNAADWTALFALAAEGAGRDLGPWTEARYNSRCRTCGERWKPGDLIRYDENEGAWICEQCGS